MSDFLTVCVSDPYHEIDRAGRLLKTGLTEDGSQEEQTVEVTADQRDSFPVASSIQEGAGVSTMTPPKREPHQSTLERCVSVRSSSSVTVNVVHDLILSSE